MANSVQTVETVTAVTVGRVLMRTFLGWGVFFLLLIALFAAIGHPVSIARTVAISMVVLGFRIHAQGNHGRH